MEPDFLGSNPRSTYNLLAVWPWAGDLVSLCFNFSKEGVGIRAGTLLGDYEN